MKEEKLLYILLHGKRSACVSSVPLVPCHDYLDILASNITRFDRTFYDSFDLIWFFYRPINKFSSWRALLLELCNIGKEDFILCLKVSGEISIILDFLSPYCKNCFVIDSYKDRKTLSNNIFFAIKGKNKEKVVADRDLYGDVKQKLPLIWKII